MLFRSYYFHSNPLLLLRRPIPLFHTRIFYRQTQRCRSATIIGRYAATMSSALRRTVRQKKNTQYLPFLLIYFLPMFSFYLGYFFCLPSPPFSLYLCSFQSCYVPSVLLHSSFCHFTPTLLHRPFSPTTSALVWMFRMLFQTGWKGEFLSMIIDSWTGPGKRTSVDFDTTTL